MATKKTAAKAAPTQEVEQMPDFDTTDVGLEDDADQGYVYVDAIDAWIVTADKTVWTSFESMQHHLHAAQIATRLDAYMDHVEATAREALTVPAREAGIIQSGPLKGQMREARPEKVPTDRAVKQYVSKIRSAVEDYLKWEVAQG